VSITTRPATAADAPAVLALWRRAEAEPSRTDGPAFITQLIAHDPNALILAESDGSIVGSVIAAWDGWRGSIYRLAVAPDYRRTGLGRRLISEAEQRLTEVGAVRMQAIVVESDVQATGFWRASEWEEQVERLRFVKG
jgi:ribosomal protein S18 acetylase RimI-like enzyme